MPNPNICLQNDDHRGVKVYPDGAAETARADMWRCRYPGENISFEHILALLEQLNRIGSHINQIENLYLFDGERGYCLGQGE